MEARVCKSCGVIYARKAGMRIVSSCPSCNSSSKKVIEIEADE